MKLFKIWQQYLPTFSIFSNGRYGTSCTPDLSVVSALMKKWNIEAWIFRERERWQGGQEAGLLCLHTKENQVWTADASIYERWVEWVLQSPKSNQLRQLLVWRLLPSRAGREYFKDLFILCVRVCLPACINAHCVRAYCPQRKTLNPPSD